MTSEILPRLPGMIPTFRWMRGGTLQQRIRSWASRLGLAWATLRGGHPGKVVGKGAGHRGLGIRPLGLRAAWAIDDPRMSYQPFMAPRGERMQDIRVILVNLRPVAAYLRVSADKVLSGRRLVSWPPAQGAILTNVSAGGERVEPPGELRREAFARAQRIASRLADLEVETRLLHYCQAGSVHSCFCSIDFLVSSRGLVFCEYHATPSWPALPEFVGPEAVMDRVAAVLAHRLRDGMEALYISGGGVSVTPHLVAACRRRKLPILEAPSPEPAASQALGSPSSSPPYLGDGG